MKLCHQVGTQRAQRSRSAHAAAAGPHGLVIRRDRCEITGCEPRLCVDTQLLADAPRTGRLALQQPEFLAVARDRPTVPAPDVQTPHHPKPLAAQVTLRAVLIRVIRDLPERSEVWGSVGKTAEGDGGTSHCDHRTRRSTLIRR
jgi:hypothetical protein